MRNADYARLSTQAEVDLKEGRPLGALAAFKQALAACKDAAAVDAAARAETYLYREYMQDGERYEQQGEWSRAIAAYQNALGHRLSDRAATKRIERARAQVIRIRDLATKALAPAVPKEQAVEKAIPPQHSEQAATKGRQMNLALESNGARVTAISEGVYLNNRQYARYAIDGDPKTSWASQWDIPAWLQIELEKPQRITALGIVWGEGTHNQQFVIEVSLDGSSWKRVAGPRWSRTDANDSSGRPDHGYRGNSHIVRERLNIRPVDARYVRFTIQKTQAPSSHIFQAIIHEAEVYGASS
ncbi:MAG: discoidin domain-containing protein [Chloroflexota bacterium]